MLEDRSEKHEHLEKYLMSLKDEGGIVNFNTDADGEKKYLFMMTCKFFLALKISVMFVGVCWSMLETFSSAIFALCFNLSSKLIGFRQQKELFRHSQCPI